MSGYRLSLYVLKPLTLKVYAVLTSRLNSRKEYFTVPITLINLIISVYETFPLLLLFSQMHNLLMPHITPN